MRKEFIVIALALVLGGCEIGEKQRASSATANSNKSSAHIAKKVESKIKTIYSNKGIPGYYIQVGYFVESKPTEEFLEKVKSSGLEYKILEKYRDGKRGYYLLVGPYISYNRASKDLERARENITSSAFIVKVEKPN